MKKKLVIVSHVFAPSNHPNAKRPYLMAKYLVRKGWDVTVLTTAFQSRGKRPSNMDGIHVECIPSWPISIIEYASTLPAFREKLLRLFQGVLFPDLFAPWMHRAAKRLRTMDYDCAILNVLPYAAFLLMQDGVLDSRWIIDYQESVYPHLKKHPRTSPLQKAYAPRLLALERAALARCGGAWFTAKTNRERYIADGAVDESKTAYLPYFYDPDLYSESASGPKEEMIVLYGGKLDGSWRSPATFFKAWASFIKQHPEAADRVRLVLYGSMDEACLRMAESCGLQDKIDIREPIPYREFLGEAKRADVLLYIDAHAQELFNPGKLADYFGAERPILGFTTAGSEVEEMLKNTGMEPFISAPNDVEGGTASLIRLWNIWTKERAPVSLSPLQYSASFVCDRVDQILQQRLIRITV